MLTTTPTTMILTTMILTSRAAIRMTRRAMRATQMARKVNLIPVRTNRMKSRTGRETRQQPLNHLHLISRLLVALSHSTPLWRPSMSPLNQSCWLISHVSTYPRVSIIYLCSNSSGTVCLLHSLHG
ncbi:hypothetical protein FA15DRAFT_137163 [Coprinopsis marcescibilis]|uniref:Uncharacterized protein n=1 Tax=Coprinopsis marcescibilis TaxID=230819 RepID=A0A5C3KJ25_COPMA|nr:hypothetical protein FA15DRAFT_137163 [Coprinopsis marcescibilis]